MLIYGAGGWLFAVTSPSSALDVEKKGRLKGEKSSKSLLGQKFK